MTQSKSMDLFKQLDIKHLSQDELDDLVAEASSYALISGLFVEVEDSPDEMQRCPFMLLPTPYPKKLFQEVWDLERDLHILFHKISRDHEFLSDVLEGSTKSDPSFTGRIYDIYEKSRRESIIQPLSLTITRLDYILDEVADAISNNNEDLKISSVEYNDVPGSILMGERTTDVSSYVLGLMGKDVPNGSVQLPCNRPFIETCDSLATAWEYYGSKHAVILLIIGHSSNRMYEMYFHQRKPRIRVLRRSLESLTKTARLDKDRRLFVEGHEVAITFFRMGTEPKCYPSEECWDVRLLIERSHAIKVPTLAIRLALGKPVQQKLTEPGVLERYLSDKDKISRIRKTFKRIYNFQGDDAHQIAEMAIKNPHNFVLKPDRDGGGHNFFGDDIRTQLQSVSSLERTQYILMEKINYEKSAVKNYLIRPSKPNKAELAYTYSELGIFGILLSCGDTILVNKPSGYLLRTKPLGVLDGGILNGGLASHSTPYLV